jgi:hypothetical protein
MADGASWRFSSARARRELGWQTTALDEAILTTLASYRA